MAIVRLFGVGQSIRDLTIDMGAGHTGAGSLLGISVYGSGGIGPHVGRGLRATIERVELTGGYSAKVKKKVESQIMREKVNELFNSRYPKYNSTIMILAKSRGSSLNLVNISGMWGQASVREGRPRRGFRNRLITSNKENDVGALAGGFIRRNFMDGLDPKEFFYHSMGGRQGEVDTGVATKVSGYLYRRLANSLKDLVVIEDGSVRTAAGNIIQFTYGEDGVFPAKAYHSKSVDAGKEYKKFAENEKGK
jgi:DNA-directed RNA polymerase subunit A'